jgi:hypothetical protein
MTAVPTPRRVSYLKVCGNQERGRYGKIVEALEALVVAEVEDGGGEK